MAKIITALENEYSIENRENKKLFLAGGITGCEDWQSKLINYLIGFDELTVYNPRRKQFPMDNPDESERQIVWEFEKLKESDYISFYFAKGTDNPIVLYELGMWGNSRNKKIVIGLEEGYSRTQDVIIQTRLARPEVHVIKNCTIENLASAIKFKFILQR